MNYDFLQHLKLEKDNRTAVSPTKISLQHGFTKIHFFIKLPYDCNFINNYSILHSVASLQKSISDV